MQSSHDILEPEEYKDMPLVFTLVLDGRKEPVKLVEPEVDFPMPNGGTLLVDQGENRRLCDMIFIFDRTEAKPYKLNFNAMLGTAYDQPQQVSFGPLAPEQDNLNLAAVYHMIIVTCGDVQARIEMTGGKARLHVTFQR